MDNDMTRADWLNEASDAGFRETEYNFFLGWQDAVSSFMAIANAAGRHEILTLQRIINADIADACGRHGTWVLDSWAEDYALDIQNQMTGAVDSFVHGCRSEAFDIIDGLQDMIRSALERAETPDQ